MKEARAAAGEKALFHHFPLRLIKCIFRLNIHYIFLSPSLWQLRLSLLWGSPFTKCHWWVLSSYSYPLLGRIKNHQLIVLYSIWGWEGRFSKINDNAPALISGYFNVGPQIVLKYKVSYEWILGSEETT